MKKHKILIVEDEADLASLLQYNLNNQNFITKIADDGEKALMLVQEDQPDLILLDWMIPLISGIEVCRQIKKSQATSHIPIIMLTARGEEKDKLRGFDLGADDYIVKPFSVNELIARIKLLLRRSNVLADTTLIYHDLKMDLITYRVFKNNHEIHLSPTEFKLLRYFMENPARVFNREHLLDHIWGKDIYVEPRTVDVHIRRLRKALNHYPPLQNYIRTVRAAGYALDYNN
ncbi:MAG: phosphate regulon transcriptional regulator PhoB [Alphaproteobacteria bacterium]|nr:phosphate regulon transcriptional regulator PhoB [Alphaproteobacteria bacterium]